MAKSNIPMAERFWQKVRRLGPDECWPWLASSRTSDGYGSFDVGSRKTVQAHRFSWQITNGPIPLELCVLHRCDNPPCVNPGHLFLGTRKDNNADKEKKGRSVQLHGSQHGMAKVTETDVVEIRTLIRTGLPQHLIAKRFGVSQVHISRINLRKTWAHVE